MAIDQHTLIRENYEALLLGYAAGLLDQAQQFAVCTHLSMSPPARQFVKKCEAIGGALMECECAPATMKGDALGNVLGKLDAQRPQPQPQQQKQQAQPKRPVQLPPEIQIPLAILQTLSCRPCEPRWVRHVRGLSICELPLECRESSVRFIKAEPAARLPHNETRGQEITLVLRGAYVDDFGIFRRGDMLVLDDTVQHEPGACNEQGIVAMVVSAAPQRLSGLASIINALLR